MGVTWVWRLFLTLPTRSLTSPQKPELSSPSGRGRMQCPQQLTCYCRSLSPGSFLSYSFFYSKVILLLVLTVLWRMELSFAFQEASVQMANFAMSARWQEGPASVCQWARVLVSQGALCLLQSCQKDFAPNGPPSFLLLAVCGQSGQSRYGRGTHYVSSGSTSHRRAVGTVSGGARQAALPELEQVSCSAPVLVGSLSSRRCQRGWKARDGFHDSSKSLLLAHTEARTTTDWSKT